MKRITTRLLLAVAATFLLLAQECPPRDYTKDDHEGELPQGQEESGIGKTFRVDTPQPNPLSCDTTYYFRSVGHASGVTCNGYDFNPLYDQTGRTAEARANEMQCKQGPDSQCKTLKTWRSWHEWTCTTNSSGTGNADVIVVYAATCPKNTDTYPQTPKVDRPSTDALKAPYTNPGSAPGTTEQIETSGGPDLVGCNPLRILKYRYQYQITPRPQSVEAYASDGENLARQYAETLECAAGCRKGYKRLKTDWSYDGQYVIIDVWFMRCRP